MARTVVSLSLQPELYRKMKILADCQSTTVSRFSISVIKDFVESDEDAVEIIGGEPVEKTGVKM